MPVSLSLPLLHPLGMPATASTSSFLSEMRIGSPLPVREPTSFQTKEETRWLPTTKNPVTLCDAAISRPQSGRTKARRDRSSATTFSRPFKDQSGAWRNGTSDGLNDLEALMNVALEAKEWIAAHVMKR